MPVNRKLAWTLLILCLVPTFAIFAYPLYVIRPFRPQGPAELAAALAIHQWGPLLAAIESAGAILLTALMWRTAKRTALALTTLTIAFAALAQINVYEIMFHRIASPQTMPAAEAQSQGKIDNDDMVIAIKLTGQSRAYPVRMMAYHHVVNDRLGGLPIVSTY
jgi:hypothetical protein